MQYFNYENYRALVAAVGVRAKDGDADANEDMEYISGHFSNFVSYIKAISDSEVGIHLASGSLDGNEKQQRVTELDRIRSKTHDSAIASASAINRIAAFYGIGNIYTGDPAVRRQVAAFCMEVATVLFENRR